MKIKLILMVMLFGIIGAVNSFAACNVKQADGTIKQVTLDYVVEDAEGTQMSSYIFLKDEEYKVFLTVDGVKDDTVYESLDTSVTGEFTPHIALKYDNGDDLDPSSDNCTLELNVPKEQGAAPMMMRSYSSSSSGSSSGSSGANKLKFLVVALTLEVEASSDTDTTELAECMEGRDITFTAKVEGAQGASLFTSVEYEFCFEDAEGHEWSEIVSSTVDEEDYTATADDVPDNDSDHNFETPVYFKVTIDGVTYQSTTKNIKVWELWIKEFKDNANNKDWKVCVGDAISYEAESSKHCKNWDWDMEDGFPDAWDVEPGNSKKGTNMKIKYSSLSDAKNSWFGEKYGTVNVWCEDGENNNHRFYSTTDNKKAQVFFPRDKNIDGQPPTSAKPACWYVFWSADKGGPAAWRLNSTTSHAGATIRWGYDPSISGNAVTSFGSSITITMGNAVGARNWVFSSPRYPTSGNFTNSAGVSTFFPAGKVSLSYVKPDHESIDSVIQTQNHELQHVTRYQKLTGLIDSDNDWLSDSFEDSYGTDYTRKRTYSSFYLSGDDDELDAEDSATKPTVSANVDWAFPGKQWY